MTGRPRAVTIIAGFLFAATGIAFFVGGVLLFPGQLLEWVAQFNRPGMQAFEVLGRWSGLLLVALGGGTFAAALGLCAGRKWAWWFAVVLFAVDGCGDLVALFATGELLRTAVGVAVSATFLYSLTRPRVRSYFKEGI